MQGEPGLHHGDKESLHFLLQTAGLRAGRGQAVWAEEEEQEGEMGPRMLFAMESAGCLSNLFSLLP